MSIETLYRQFRNASPFMLVGENARQALQAARTIEQWNELESAGLVGIRAKFDDDPDASFYDTWEHLSERSKAELKQRYYEDCWIVETFVVDDNGERVGTGVNNIGCGTSREVRDYLQDWFYNEINRLDKLQNFKAGELAYIDCFTGLVPCKVLQVVESGTPTQCVTSGKLTVRVTAKRGAYRVGEVIENQTCHNVVPRAMVRVSGGKHRINTSYQWVK